MQLQPSGERHLRTRLVLARSYPDDLLAETLRVAERCTFSLDELRYEYPEEVVPDGETPTTYLRRLTYEGAGRRFPAGIPDTVHQQIEHELQLIADLGYQKYFLTVYDIVRFAKAHTHPREQRVDEKLWTLYQGIAAGGQVDIASCGVNAQASQ